MCSNKSHFTKNKNETRPLCNAAPTMRWPYLNISAKVTQSSSLERAKAAARLGVLMHSLPPDSVRESFLSFWTCFLHMRPEGVGQILYSMPPGIAMGILQQKPQACSAEREPYQIWHREAPQVNAGSPTTFYFSCMHQRRHCEMYTTDLETKIVLCRCGLFQQEIKMNVISLVNALEARKLVLDHFWSSENFSLIDSEQLSRSAWGVSSALLCDDLCRVVHTSVEEFCWAGWPVGMTGKQTLSQSARPASDRAQKWSRQWCVRVAARSQAIWLGQDTFLSCIGPWFLLLAAIDNNIINLIKFFLRISWAKIC